MNAVAAFLLEAVSKTSVYGFPHVGSGHLDRLVLNGDVSSDGRRLGGGEAGMEKWDQVQNPDAQGCDQPH